MDFPQHNDLLTERFHGGNNAYGIFIRDVACYVCMGLLSQSFLGSVLWDSYFLRPEIPPEGLKENCVSCCPGSCEACFHKGTQLTLPFWMTVILSYIYLSTCSKYGHLRVYLDLESSLVPLSSVMDGFRVHLSKYFSRSGEFCRQKCKVSDMREKFQPSHEKFKCQIERNGL